MTKREYAEEIAAKIGGEIQENEKTNGVVMIGIIRRVEGADIYPCVYVDQFYEDDAPIDEAAKEIEKTLEANMIDDFNGEIVMDFEKAKPNLRARLVNAKTTSEVFRSAADEGFDDLIIEPYISQVAPIENSNSSAVVSKAMLEVWGKTEDEVIDIALANSASEADIQSIEDMMAEMGFPCEKAEIPMIIVTNKARYFGAISILFVRERMERIFPNGYNVLPSSLHEVIVTAVGSADYLTSMVQEVNDTQVAPEIQLSDHVYTFN